MPADGHSRGRTTGCREETNSFGAWLLFHPCPSANYPSFAPDPTPPTLNPAPAWDRPQSFLPPSCSPPAFELPPLVRPSASPSMLPTFSSHAGPTGRPCDPAEALCGLLSFSAQPTGDSPPNTVQEPRRVKGGDKGPGGLPSLCPAAVQHPDLLLFWGKAGTAAGASGPAPLCPPRTRFGETCVVAGVFADDSGRNVRRWERPALHSPTLTRFQSQSLMQKVEEAPGYRHV